MNIGFAVCGSFCTFETMFQAMQTIAAKHKVIPIFSHNAYTLDTRYGTAQEHVRHAEELCGTSPLSTIPQVEPIGPQKLLDALIIAPCTGNTLAKIAHGIADGPVTMAVKSHLRNGRPVLVAVSTNDALSGAAENIGRLLNRKHFYFVPFKQDAPTQKPTSMVADFTLLSCALDEALQGRQMQPIIIP